MSLSSADARSLFPGAPAIELTHRDERWIDRARGRETEAAAALPMWLPGQRSARLGLAEADSNLAAAQLGHARWQLAGDVREAAWAVAMARVEMDQATRHHASLAQLTNDVERRVRAGDLARSDSLAAHSEVLAATSALAEAQLRLQQAHARWGVLTARPPLSAGQIGESRAQPPDVHPALRLAQQTLEQAREHANVVRANRRDPPELLLRYRQESDGTGSPARDSIGVGVRIPLGSDLHNVPQAAQALSQIAVAQRQLERVAERITADLEQARQALSAGEARLQSEQGRAALTRERAELITRAFNAGELGLPDALRAIAAASLAQADVDRQQAALGLARARLAQAQGLMP